MSDGVHNHSAGLSTNRVISRRYGLVPHEIGCPEQPASVRYRIFTVELLPDPRAMRSRNARASLWWADEKFRFPTLICGGDGGDEACEVRSTPTTTTRILYQRERISPDRTHAMHCAAMEVALYFIHDAAQQRCVRPANNCIEPTAGGASS